MCQHLFNSLSTIRNIYSPASTETSLICSLRKKRQTLEMVLHFRGRKGKWAVVFYLSSGNASAEPEQVPQPGAATPAWLLRVLLLFQKHKEHAELILGSQTFPASFPAPAFHSQPFRKSLGLSLLLHNPWSCSFSVWLICPCTEDLCSGTKTFELCAKSVALPDLAAQRTRPQKHQFRISLRMALQTPCLGHDCGSGGRAGGIFS